jgi:hypothetical protein
MSKKKLQAEFDELHDRCEFVTDRCNNHHNRINENHINISEIEKRVETHRNLLWGIDEKMKNNKIQVIIRYNTGAILLRIKRPWWSSWWFRFWFASYYIERKFSNRECYDEFKRYMKWE